MFVLSSNKFHSFCFSHRYTACERADISKYTCEHGLSAAATCRHFSKKFGQKISVTTVHSIKRAYAQGVREKRAASDDDCSTLKELLPKKHGRPTLLEEALDSMVQLHLRKVRKGGGVVMARIVMAAARGILSCDLTMLAEFGRHVELNRH